MDVYQKHNETHRASSPSSWQIQYSQKAGKAGVLQTNWPINSGNWAIIGLFDIL